MKKVSKVLPISKEVVASLYDLSKKAKETQKQIKEKDKKYRQIYKEHQLIKIKLLKEKRQLIKERGKFDLLIEKRVNYIANLYVKEFGGELWELEWQKVFPNSRIMNLLLGYNGLSFFLNNKRMKVAHLMFKRGIDNDYYTNLPIPTKWLYEDFEEEFYSKVKMIRTFG